MNMLKTSEERVRLLKAGMSSKDIEKLYLKNNEFRIVMGNVPMDILYMEKYVDIGKYSIMSKMI